MGISLAVLVETDKQFEIIIAQKALGGKIKYVFVRNPALLSRVGEMGFGTGLCGNIVDKASLLDAIGKASLVDILLLEFKDPTNIPLELVLAKTQATNTRVFKKVRFAQDGEVSLMTMEKGSDGILLVTASLADIVALNGAYRKYNIVSLDLRPAIVKRIEHAGMGDRVCIDTTSELFKDEGMILGSTSSGGLMVCSETHFLPTCSYAHSG